ncbi:hypothetical protein M9Y10_043611 [Tritrichomonas musculus]|uniref:Ras-GEF domain-containing protein n=1 Tax=Tritrichomonas musculus TaxID=1915356 RepID=A0ABR2K0A8_9EUKA
MKKKRSSSESRNRSLKQDQASEIDQIQKMHHQNANISQQGQNQQYQYRNHRSPRSNHTEKQNSSFQIQEDPNSSNHSEMQVKSRNEDTRRQNYNHNHKIQQQNQSRQHSHQSQDWNSQSQDQLHHDQELRRHHQQQYQNQQLKQSSNQNAQQQVKQYQIQNNRQQQMKHSPSQNDQEKRQKLQLKQSSNQNNQQKQYLRQQPIQNSQQSKQENQIKQSPDRYNRQQQQSKQQLDQNDQQKKELSNHRQYLMQPQNQNNKKVQELRQKEQNLNKSQDSISQGIDQTTRYRAQPKRSSQKAKPNERPIIGEKEPINRGNTYINNNFYANKKSESEKNKKDCNSNHDSSSVSTNSNIQKNSSMTPPCSLIKSYEISTNNSISIKSDRPKLEIANTLNIIYYFDNPDPPKIGGRVVAFSNDKILSFRKRRIIKKHKVVHDEIKNDENESDDGPPVTQFLESTDINDNGASLSMEEESQSENEDIINDQIDSNDLMSKYWPKISESQRTFENEYALTESTRVPSIRHFETISPNIQSPKPEPMPSPVPQKFTEFEKNYSIAPPSRISPCHRYNPRKRKNDLKNKILCGSPLSTPKTKNNPDHLNFTTPTYSLHPKASLSQPELEYMKTDLEESENEDVFYDENEIANNNESIDENESKDENEIEDEIENEDKIENNFIQTNKKFSLDLYHYQDMINAMDAEDAYSNLQNIDNDLKCSNCMTTIKGPLFEEEMTVVRFVNMNCEIIENIYPKAFTEFRFGNCVYYNDDISPDEIHLNAWHNLGIDPDKMSISLDQFIDQNILGNNDRSNIFGVLRYIVKWIQFYPDDFFLNPDCANHTCKALNRIIDKISNEKNPEIISRSNILKAFIRAISQGNKTLSAVKKPLNKVNKVHFKKYEKISIYETIFDFKKNIPLLVDHFSYIDLCLIHKIIRSELIQMKFHNAEDKQYKCPNYYELTNRFNIVARFVSFSILSVVRNYANSLQKRSKTRIEFWINMMKRARDCRNFALVYQIDAGLCHPSISKLKDVWKIVKNKEEFEEIHQITVPISSNMKKYMNMLMEKPEKTVPYFGAFLSQMAYLHDSHKREEVMMIPQNKLNNNLSEGKKIKNDQLVEVKGYNMVYQYFISKEISKIFQNWGVDYKFNIDPNLLRICTDISYTCDDSTLSKYSNQIISNGQK